MRRRLGYFFEYMCDLSSEIVPGSVGAHDAGDTDDRLRERGEGMPDSMAALPLQAVAVDCPARHLLGYRTGDAGASTVLYARIREKEVLRAHHLSASHRGDIAGISAILFLEHRATPRGECDPSGGVAG